MQLAELSATNQTNMNEHTEQIQNNDFILHFKRVMEEVHKTAIKKGWWKKRETMVSVARHAEIDNEFKNGGLTKFAIDSNAIVCLALAVTEISEAIEAIRNHNPPDDKIPKFSGAEAECADAVIRIMDVCQAYGWDLPGAIVAKMEMNKGREHMHGGKAL